jgi:hypothetical protein
MDYFVSKILTKDGLAEVGDLLSQLTLELLRSTVGEEIEEHLLQAWKALLELLRSYCYMSGR